MQLYLSKNPLNESNFQTLTKVMPSSFFSIHAISKQPTALRVFATTFSSYQKAKSKPVRSLTFAQRIHIRYATRPNSSLKQSKREKLTRCRSSFPPPVCMASIQKMVSPSDSHTASIARLLPLSTFLSLPITFQSTNLHVCGPL